MTEDTKELIDDEPFAPPTLTPEQVVLMDKLANAFAAVEGALATRQLPSDAIDVSFSDVDVNGQGRDRRIVLAYASITDLRLYAECVKGVFVGNVTRTGQLFVRDWSNSDSRVTDLLRSRSVTIQQALALAEAVRPLVASMNRVQANERTALRAATARVVQVAHNLLVPRQRPQK